MEEKSGFYTVRGYQLLGRDDNVLTSSMEDYLEMIYRYSLREGYMRINALSEQLNVAASSATHMVQKLNRMGLIHYRKYGILYLTDQGIEIGKYLLKRHDIVQNFLSNLGVTQDLLLETELMEHNISQETLKKLELFNTFLESDPDIRDRFNIYVITENNKIKPG